MLSSASVGAPMHRSHPTLSPNRLDVVAGFKRSASHHSILIAWAADLMVYDSFMVGEAINPKVALWSVAKALMLCEQKLTGGTPIGCHCLNMFKFKPLGCCHHHVPLSSTENCQEVFPAGICDECSQCLRCNGYLDCKLHLVPAILKVSFTTNK